MTPGVIPQSENPTCVESWQLVFPYGTDCSDYIEARVTPTTHIEAGYTRAVPYLSSNDLPCNTGGDHIRESGNLATNIAVALQDPRFRGDDSTWCHCEARSAEAISKHYEIASFRSQCLLKGKVNILRWECNRRIISFAFDKDGVGDSE